MSHERTKIEASYRKYFYDIRGFRPFPMEITLENLIDFVLWREADHKIEAARERRITWLEAVQYCAKAYGTGSLSMEEIRGAVARGWCHEENSHMIMDCDLAEAISQEVQKLLAPDTRLADAVEKAMGKEEHSCKPSCHNPCLLDD